MKKEKRCKKRVIMLIIAIRFGKDTEKENVDYLLRLRSSDESAKPMCTSTIKIPPASVIIRAFTLGHSFIFGELGKNKKSSGRFNSYVCLKFPLSMS